MSSPYRSSARPREPDVLKGMNRTQKCLVAIGALWAVKLLIDVYLVTKPK